MDFKEKLSFLLQITGTNSIDLAKHAGISRSMISLYKNGKRNRPRKEETLRAFSDFFAFHISDTFQKQALYNKMEDPIIFKLHDPADISDRILSWFKNTEYTPRNITQKIFEAIDAPSAEPSQTSLETAHRHSSQTFYGNSGKVNALSIFLEHVLAVEQPKTLYINADDNCEWFFHDPTTGNHFTDVMKILIQKGCTIIFLLPPPTNDYFLDTFINWLPLYMTGKVIPYFYPRYKNEAFRFFMLAMEEEAALVSYGIYKSTSDGFASFSTEPQFVKVIVQMLLDYKKLCHPVLHIYTHTKDILEAYKRHLSPSSASYALRSHLPLEINLPANSQDTTVENQSLFEAILEKRQNTPCPHPVIDFCKIATVSQIYSGKVIIPSLDNDSRTDSGCTPANYKKQLVQIVNALEKYDNYYFIPLPPNEEIQGTALIQQNISILLIENTPCRTVFEIKEPAIVKVCEEYIFRKLDTITNMEEEKQIVIKQLKQLIQKI